MTTRSRPPEGRTGFTPRVVPAGDAAQMLELAHDADPHANALARHIAEEVRAAQLPGITDVVAAIVTVTVHFDATGNEPARLRDAVSRLLMAALNRARTSEEEPARAPHEIPVCYEERFAPDLADVAQATGLSPDEVVRCHTASPHRVLMIGFAPGFPYIGGLDERLAVPRRAAPRPRLAAGSVAIANGQTAIYPFDTPGGWNIIGRTPLRLFDPSREPVTLLQAGDPVAFVPISAGEFERLAAQAGAP